MNPSLENEYLGSNIKKDQVNDGLSGAHVLVLQEIQKHAQRIANKLEAMVEKVVILRLSSVLYYWICQFTKDLIEFKINQILNRC
jgi:hypothetical protein